METPFLHLKHSKKGLMWLMIFNVLYAIWVHFVVGWRSDHINLMTIWTLLYILFPYTQKMFFCYIYLIVYWFFYDSMRVFPNFMFADVNILEPYLIEKDLFGLTHDGLRITWNEYFQAHTNKALDFITGVFYLSWVPVPFAYCIYLYVKKEYELVVGFTLTFLTVNILGWIIYYAYPAAPPWYFEKFGTEFIADTIGDPAGLIRFDHLMGGTMFSDLYSKSSSVFGAIPSLHAAFPLILSYFSLKRKNPILTLLFIITLIGILFSAIYTNHHYILDILIGMICGVLSLIVYEKILNKSLKKYLISPILGITNNYHHA